jgi:hypothetical protein
MEIVKLKIPGIDDRLVTQLVNTISEIRTLDLKKKPCTSETLDWAKSLLALQVEDLSGELIIDTLNLICKYRSDSDLVNKRIKEISSTVNLPWSTSS